MNGEMAMHDIFHKNVFQFPILFSVGELDHEILITFQHYTLICTAYTYM